MDADETGGTCTSDEANAPPPPVATHSAAMSGVRPGPVTTERIEQIRVGNDPTRETSPLDTLLLDRRMRRASFDADASDTSAPYSSLTVELPSAGVLPAPSDDFLSPVGTGLVTRKAENARQRRLSETSDGNGTTTFVDPTSDATGLDVGLEQLDLRVNDEGSESPTGGGSS